MITRLRFFILICALSLPIVVCGQRLTTAHPLSAGFAINELSCTCRIAPCGEVLFGVFGAQ